MLINYTNLNGEEEWFNIKDLGVYIHSKSLPESPSVEVIDTSSVSKRKLFLEKNFTHREMSVQLAVVKYSKEGLRDTLTTLTGMLKGRFNLIFKDNENQMYRDVVLTSEIGVDAVTNSVYILTLQMTAYDPFRYGLENNSELISVSNSTEQIMIFNEGNYTAKPIIKLKGFADKININVNGKTLSYVNLVSGEEILINNFDYTVIRNVGSGNKNALANWRDNFIELESGENVVTITGDNFSVEITVEFRDTFL